MNAVATMVPNYDEDVTPTSIDEVMEFFVTNDANSKSRMIEVGRALDKEFTGWVRFQGRSFPGDDEVILEMEAEWLEDEYPTMQKIEDQFALVFPYLIDAAELV